MSMHLKPITESEREGLVKHGLAIGKASQLSDCFRLGMRWALDPLNQAPIINEKWSTKARFEAFINSHVCTYHIDLNTWGLKYTTPNTQSAFEAFEFQQKRIDALRFLTEIKTIDEVHKEAFFAWFNVCLDNAPRESALDQAWVLFSSLHGQIEKLKADKSDELFAVDNGKTIYLVRRKGQDDFISCAKERFDELASNSLFEVMTCKQESK